jgi:ATP-dependent Clp protease adaptor protein ClpS
MPIALPEPRVAPDQRLGALWHVVLLDDDDHSYEYVIEMLGRLFGTDPATAFVRACVLDSTGRVVVDTTTRERAELKQEQIHSYGPDFRLPRCAGSMSSELEPA